VKDCKCSIECYENVRDFLKITIAKALKTLSPGSAEQVFKNNESLVRSIRFSRLLSEAE